jgi:acyl-CoA reductase-like NAD-dependent aldehyde dehydrogenase
LQPIKLEKIIHKSFYSAFEEGKLDGVLDSLKSDTIFIAGLYLHSCIRATVLDAYQRGFKIWIAEDAVASDDSLHATVTRHYLEKRAANFVKVDYLLALMDMRSYESNKDVDTPKSLPAMIIADSIVNDDKLERFIHISPRQNNSKLWSVSICGDKQVSQATTEAKRAWSHWRDASTTSRLNILKRLADLLESESFELAKQMAMEIGKPIRYGQSEVSRCVSLLKAIAHRANDKLQRRCGPKSMFRYKAVGVIAMVTPWNNPLAIPIGKIAPALFYGNTVVWKPAPEASSIVIRLMEILRLAGCPPGVVNLVCGDSSTAKALMSDEGVDAITLTGSLAAGYSAQYICTNRHIPLQAELGGNNASIIWSDCDLKKAAFSVAEAGFELAGQRCTANRRVIVEKCCYDTFLKYLETAVAALIWGDPIDQRTQVGPLISNERRDRVAAIVSRAKAAAETVLAPHKEDLHYAEFSCRGAYFPPTVICCDDPNQEIVQEETFGPVMVMQRASDWDHALDLCNGVKQGLVAALFSQSKNLQRTFLDKAKAGILKINCPTTGVDVEAPFGGWKSSGIGAPEHGACDRQFYTRIQSIYL